MEKLLSVVIPVYKVEAYINKCLDSLLVEPPLLNKLDVLIVNDGTPDNSAELSREYVKRYPDVFRQIDKENGGHGSAWNVGTAMAVGKYLFYLDSDDWVNTADFAKLIVYLENCDTDLVMLDRQIYHAVENSYTKTVHEHIEPERIYCSDTFDWLGCGEGSNITYAHNTVYRTAMMQKYLPMFCEHVMYDDVSLQVTPIAISRSFVYTKLDVYRYYVGRPGQSFDAAVRAVRAADDVTLVVKFLLKWIVKYRTVAPEGTTRRAWVDDHYSAFCTWHYNELSLFTKSVAQPRLKEWDDYIRKEYPDITLTCTVRMYRALPFTAYIAWFKARRFLTRAWRFAKRKIAAKTHMMK